MQHVVLKEISEYAEMKEIHSELLGGGYDVKETSKMVSRLTRRPCISAYEKAKKNAV